MKYYPTHVDRYITSKQLNIILEELKYGNYTAIPYNFVEDDLCNTVHVTFRCQGYSDKHAPQTYVRFTNDDRRKFIKLAVAKREAILKGITQTISFETSLPTDLRAL
jgi:hypothetical protein